MLAAACQPGGDSGGTAGSSGTSGGAGTSGASGASGGAGSGGGAGSTGGSSTGGGGGTAGGGGGAAGTSGAAGRAAARGRAARAGTTGAAGASGSAGNGGRGGGGAAGTTGAAGTGGRGGSSGGTGGQAGAGGTGGLVCTTPPPSGTSYAVDATGVTFTLNPGRMRLQVCQADIIRITYTNASSIPSKTSLSVNASWGTPSFCVTEAAGVLTITTSRMKAKVTESTGLVSYTDLNDNALVSEYSKSLTAATVEGVATNTVAAAFNSPDATKRCSVSASTRTA